MWSFHAWISFWCCICHKNTHILFTVTGWSTANDVSPEHFQTLTRCMACCLLVEVYRAEPRGCCIWTHWWGGWVEATTFLQAHTDLPGLRERTWCPLHKWKWVYSKFCFFIKCAFTHAPVCSCSDRIGKARGEDGHCGVWALAQVFMVQAVHAEQRKGKGYNLHNNYGQ